MPRRALLVRGVVQGVGFRPFVARHAGALGLGGWVRNRADGVEIEIQGGEEALDAFAKALRDEPREPMRLERLDAEGRPEISGDCSFRILASATEGRVVPSTPPDLAACSDCLAEIGASTDRRYRYAFTSCTRCGPRYSIASNLPYDRARTTMHRFAMCARCAAEYADPSDRRFHAEAIACAACGPSLRLLAPGGELVASGEDALPVAARAIAAGKILALQGLGGFQLLVAAGDAGALRRLRRGKGRPDKPFAVMFGSLGAVRSACELSAAEAEALASPEGPIVLLRRLGGSAARATIDEGVAPQNPRLGVLLPTTPLHHLLLASLGAPVVCTSGNLSGEPIAIDEADARARLHGIADLFLVHDRPIVRPIDDSVARMGDRGLEVLRRARGFAPCALSLARVPRSGPVLALGGHLKSTAALLFEGRVLVSQHLGDLDTTLGVRLLERTALDLVATCRVRPERIACDLHPDYASTRLAERLAEAWECPVVPVQHHHAHVAACVAEHGLEGPVLGLAWDGAGYGLDGSIWGGEALRVNGAEMTRVAHFEAFRLPGGERAIREPRRAALGLLSAVSPGEAQRYAMEQFGEVNGAALLTMLARATNAPLTTSVGRLFDAVAALAGVRTMATFEGQAAMDLEHLAETCGETTGYPVEVRPAAPAVVDVAAIVRGVLADRRAGTAAGVIAKRFHLALAEAAMHLAEIGGEPRVVIAGGCFRNALLSRLIRDRLTARGFEVFVPRLYPPDDGGLSLGQALVVAMKQEA